MRLAAWVLLGVALGLTGCAPRPTKVAASLSPLVEVAGVAAPSTFQSVRFTGRVGYDREYTLSFPAPGALESVAVEPGDVLKPGQLIARLDRTPFLATSAQTGVEVERARRELERDRQLFEQGYVSRQRLADRETTLAFTEAAHRKTVFEQGRAQIYARQPSVVLERTAEPGETVQAGAPIVRLGDLSSRLILRGAVADRDVAGLHPGDPARLFLDATSAPLQGRLIRIGRQVDPQTGTILIEIGIDAPPPGLRSGQVATAEVAVRGAPASDPYLRVPVEALVEVTGRTATVLVVGRDARAVRAVVAFGGIVGDEARIQGLPLGARVITTGAALVSPGAAVRVARPQLAVAGPRS